MKLKAYTVTEEYEGCCVVEFADRAVVARRNGANELNAEFGEVSCRRAPWADKCAPGPVPIEAEITKGGFWYECHCGCGRRVDADEGIAVDADENPMSPVYGDRLVYWNQGCKDTDERRRREESEQAVRQQAEAEAAVLAKFPFATDIRAYRRNAGRSIPPSAQRWRKKGLVMSEQPKPKASAGDIRAALRERFPTSSHALMFEVGNGTGHRTNRHADAIAMGLWPSRGMEVEGVEIKVSRSDWKRELADHEKADAIQRYCDRWWIAAPKGLIPAAELPATWGLLELNGNTLRQKVPAPKLEAIALDRHFVAAMLRRASVADAQEVAALVEKKLAPRVQEARRQVEQERSHRLSQAEQALNLVEKVKAATGINLLGWHAPDHVIASIQFAMKTHLVGSHGQLENIATAAERMAADIRDLRAIHAVAREVEAHA